jgi:serine phosphatase RsbU (regulator of sigma subunit)
MNIGEKIDTLLKEANEIRNSEAEKAYALNEEAIRLCQETDDRPRLARAYVGMAQTCQYLTYIGKGFEIARKALELSLQENNIAGQGDSHFRLGNFYFLLGDFEEAQRHLQRSLDLRKQVGDDTQTAYSLNALGALYGTLKNYDLAIEHFQLCYEKHKKADMIYGQGMAMNNIAVSLIEQNRNEEALEYLDRAIMLVHKINNPMLRGEVLINRGDSFRNQGKFEEALKIYSEANLIYKGLANANSAKSYIGLTKIYDALKMFDKAIASGKEAAGILSAIGLKEQLADVYKLLADLEHKRGEHEESFRYMKEYFALREDIHKNEIRKKLDAINMIHYADNLEKEAQINHLKNVELKNAYDLVEFKNRNILDSIQYASHFQDMILKPYFEVLKTHLPWSFHISMPKDIVSGDFFWCHKNDSVLLFALVDCTGHGVPGAFMSLVGNDILQRAVREQHLFSPKGILEFIHSELQQMNQKDAAAGINESGMALSLGLLDLDQKILRYAGSQSAGFLLKEDGSIKKLGGRNFFLGGSQSAGSEEILIRLNDGDLLCFYTDGYLDQKDEETKKRPDFEGIVSDIMRFKLKGPEGLKEYIINEFNARKGSREQVDDVSFLAFKV